MYNRYVPQADGSYRRNRMEDARPRQDQQKQNKPQQRREAPCPPTPQEPECKEQCRDDHQEQHREPPKFHNESAGGFLKQLLPANFDTGDLIIVLLLLLLAGDCEEDKATAMLTMVLYLFM